ncbi:MAG: hypothetical protein QMD65_03170 [Patescibacteria group bacterium]|nr:hypothetical protein [Patescibacteria group bacterium]
MKDSQFKNLALLALGLIILAAAFYFLGGFDAFKKLKTPEQEQTWRESQELAVAQIIKAGSFDACEKVNYKSADGTDYKIVCRNNVALNKAQEMLDISWCAKLDGQLISKTDCERQILAEKVAKEKNLSVCNIATNETIKQECLFEYWFRRSIEENNHDLCNNIKIIELKNVCIERTHVKRLLDNPKRGSCDKISANLKNDCEIYLSILNGEMKKIEISKIKDTEVVFENCYKISNSLLLDKCKEL